MTTSTRASKKVRITSVIEARVKSVVSITILYSMPSGNVAFMSDRVLVTAADTSRALAPGC